MAKLLEKIQLCILLILVPDSITNGANILFIGVPAYSFFPPLLSISDSLQKYGHRSTFVVPDTFAQLPGIKSRDINVIESKSFSKFNIMEHARKQFQDTFEGKSELTSNMNIRNRMITICESIFEDNDLFTKLKEQHFDIAVFSKHPLALCYNIIAYNLSIPFVHCGVIYDAILDRIPHFPSFLSDIVITGFSENMTFRERILNTIFFIFRHIFPDMINPKNAVAKYAPERPHISTHDLWLQAEFHLIDSDVLLDYPKPMFPNYAFVAGLGLNPVKPLPDEFTRFIEKGNKGTIIVSFGSIVDNFPFPLLEKFKETFGALHQFSFIIKMDEKQNIDMENVLQKAWIPQSDLLAHPKTKLFITHCGHNGQVESVYYGVPMIGFPLLLDQHYNARRMEAKGFGVFMDIYNFKPAELVLSIQKVLENKQFNAAVKKASVIFKSRKETPRDVAAYWIDHVINFGGDYMRSKSVHMSNIQYYCLDVLAVFTLVVFLFIFVLTCCIKRLFCKRNVGKEKAE